LLPDRNPATTPPNAHPTTRLECSCILWQRANEGRFSIAY